MPPWTASLLVCCKSSSDSGKFQHAYHLGRKISEGNFDVVKEATHRRDGGDFVIKIVSKDGLSEEESAYLQEEVSILKGLDHPNIINLVETFDEPSFFFLVMEAAKGGELFDRIVAKSYYNEKEARDVCKSLLGALDYCHKKNVAHRLLKPESLLLCSESDDSDIKLSDFGFAHRVTGDKCLKTQCGTPGYVAPEILKGVAYGTKADMWSIGVIVFILLGGYPPFTSSNQRELFKLIRKGKFEFDPAYWGKISSDAKELIASLLTVDPDKRVSAEEALKSKWMTISGDSLVGKDLGKNLQQFKVFNASRKFKAAVNAVVATNRMKMLRNGAAALLHQNKDVTREPLTAEEIEEMRETFDMFDADGGGTICHEELKMVFKKFEINLSDGELQSMIDAVDEDGNNEIDFIEFQTMMRAVVKDRQEELKEAFAVFDIDGSGTTDIDELSQTLLKFGQKLSEDELQAVMSEVDEDGSGEIDYFEFCTIMTK